MYFCFDNSYHYTFVDIFSLRVLCKNIDLVADTYRGYKVGVFFLDGQ